MQRHFDSKRFGGPEVDNQLEFDGRLNGKLARLLALEDAINATSASVASSVIPPARPCGGGYEK